MTNTVTCLLFDLGGVLVDWDGVTPLLALTDNRLTPEQARRFWLESASVRAWETGKCTDDAFARGVVAELQLSITPQHFLAQFASWDCDPFPEAEAMLKALAPHFHIACLSNNNRLRWKNPSLQGLLGRFQHCFVSFETGLMKPDHAAFLHVTDQLRVPAETILFFDDNTECVQSAAEIGLVARQVQGTRAVRKTLHEFGIAV